MKDDYIYVIVKDSPSPVYPKNQVAFKDLNRANRVLDSMDEVINRSEKILDAIEMGKPVTYYIQPIILR